MTDPQTRRKRRTFRRCPKCGNRTLRFHANDIAIGRVCRTEGCGHEEVIRWR